MNIENPEVVTSIFFISNEHVGSFDEAKWRQKLLISNHIFNIESQLRFVNANGK